MIVPQWALWMAQAETDGRDFLRRLGGSMRTARGSALLFALILLALVGLFYLVRWMAAHYGGRAERSHDEPAEVFRALASRHHLSRGEAAVLREAAAARQLADPAILFARPSVFDRCLEDYVRGIASDELRRRAHEEVRPLRERLFGHIDAGTEAAAFDEADYQPLLGQNRGKEPLASSL